MKYADKLKNPKWQKKRLEILQRDGFECQFCKSTENTLHVHHDLYAKGREPWDYPDSIFKTLCYKCHSVVEFLKKHDNEFIAFDVLVHDYVDFLRYYAYCGSSSGNWFMCVVKYGNDDKIELEHLIHQDVLEFVSDKLVSLKNVL